MHVKCYEWDQFITDLIKDIHNFNPISNNDENSF